MPPRTERWTPSGVRLRLRIDRPGDLDWLMLPGGPGLGSESLHELADMLAVPGRIWMVDLPGDGSNTDPSAIGSDPYAAWPQVLLEAADAVEHPVALGHSTGGEYLLATPELEARLRGLVLVSTAPSAAWMPVFEAMTRRHVLPAVDEATAIYEDDPSDEHLRDVAVASAPWNFGPAAVERGADLLSRMPYNGPAVAWSAEHFDDTFEASWWPTSVPTLIMSGTDDRIVTQRLWDQDRFRGPHVTHTWIQGGAHFPWMEQPQAVCDAFTAFADRIA